MSELARFSAAIDTRVDATETPVVFQTPTQHVSIGFMLLLGLSTLVCWMCIFPVAQILLPAQLAVLDPINRYRDLSLFQILGAVTSLLVYPLAGAFSDRTTLRIGRRRPYIIGGVLVGAVMLLLLANTHSLLPLALEWILTGASINVALAGLITIIADRVPYRQRALISAFIGISIPLSNTLGAILVSRVASIPVSYYTIVVLLVVIIGVFMLTLRDIPLPKDVIPPFQFGSFLKGFWISPRQYPNFAWAWFTRFLLVLSYVGINSYLLYYLQDVIHYSNLFPGRPVTLGFTAFQSYFFVALFIASLCVGYLSDRSQRRKGFVIAAGIIMAVALFTLAFFSSWTTVLVAAVVLGFGYGIYTAVDIALVIAVLPSARDRGKDMGIVNIASTLPQVIAPLVGLFLVSTLHNYLLFYAFAGVAALLGALLIPRIKSVQ